MNSPPWLSTPATDEKAPAKCLLSEIYVWGQIKQHQCINNVKHGNSSNDLSQQTGLCNPDYSLGEPQRNCPRTLKLPGLPSGWGPSTLQHSMWKSIILIALWGSTGYSYITRHPSIPPRAPWTPFEYVTWVKNKTEKGLPVNRAPEGTRSICTFPLWEYVCPRSYLKWENFLSVQGSSLKKKWSSLKSKFDPLFTVSVDGGD